MAAAAPPKTLEALKSDLEAEKERLKDARYLVKNGEGSESEVVEHRKAVDRIAAQIRRMEKNGASASNGNGKASAPKAAAKSGAKASGKKSAAAKASAPKEPRPRAELRVVPGDKRVKANTNAGSLVRVPAGAAHRVTRKNRLLGVHLSVYDATLDRRFKPDKGRWIVLCEENGQYVHVSTWTGCGTVITDPQSWLDPEFYAERKAAHAEAKGKPAATK